MATNLKKILSKTWLAILLLIFPLLSSAQASAFIPQDCLSGNAEKCDLVDMVQLFANLYAFGVKYLGALALLLFVVGGIMFMTSGGNQERVTRARSILVGTSIGLAIVLGSYVIVINIQKLIGTKSAYQLDPNSSTTVAECVNKPDGTTCSGVSGNVYVCIGNLCQNGENGNATITTCVNNRSGVCINNCNTTNCNPGTCIPNYCDGGQTTQCCIPLP
jgi:hypothetical protein